jgi:hypothetical protein
MFETPVNRWAVITSLGGTGLPVEAQIRLVVERIEDAQNSGQDRPRASRRADPGPSCRRHSIDRLQESDDRILWLRDMLLSTVPRARSLGLGSWASARR